jgi:class 3 adenylate cyclase
MKASPGQTKTIQFDSTASHPKHGIAMIYDLEGFSRFFNQPDVQDYVPKFLNLVSEALSIAIYGGKAYWLPAAENLSPLPIAPVREKFLGDGAMYIWIETNAEPLSASFVATLCNRLWNLKKFFPTLLKTAFDQLPVVDLPTRVRFGIARGTIYELSRKDALTTEYIGFCLNLASRLQKYCPALDFIASARIGLSQERLDKHGYLRVVATRIKGFPREIVIVDKTEWNGLDPAARDELFEAI